MFVSMAHWESRQLEDGIISSTYEHRVYTHRLLRAVGTINATGWAKKSSGARIVCTVQLYTRHRAFVHSSHEKTCKVRILASLLFRDESCNQFCFRMESHLLWKHYTKSKYLIFSSLK